MFQAFGLLFAVPGGLFLLLLGLGRPTHLAFATTSALDGGRLGLAVGYLLVYVGALSEGIVLGVVGGVAGVVVGGLIAGLGDGAQFAIIFGLSLGATYNLRGRAWRLGRGLKEALVGGLVFFFGAGGLEALPTVTALASGGILLPNLDVPATVAARAGLPAGVLFAAAFLTGYLGLLFYPFEAIAFAVQARRARRDPARAVVHLRRSPLTHESRRLPLCRRRRPQRGTPRRDVWRHPDAHVEHGRDVTKR